MCEYKGYERETYLPQDIETQIPRIGIVINCQKLNVRKGPSSYADALCTINETAEVLIEDMESSNEYYKVCTESGIEGFCNKNFIAIKQ